MPAKDGAEIDRKNEVILVRWLGAAYAFNLSCPHRTRRSRGTRAAIAFSVPSITRRYQPDGTFIDGRATRGMDR